MRADGSGMTCMSPSLQTSDVDALLAAIDGAGPVS